MAIWATPGAVAAFYATARAGLSLTGQRVHYAGRLSEVRQPVLLVWGRQDATIPVAHALAAARALPDARLRVFERCGHMPMWEYPGPFAETVLAFLREGDEAEDAGIAAEGPAAAGVPGAGED
jgi:pimeloyl-ACP methyl ester carboxylesterase